MSSIKSDDGVILSYMNNSKYLTWYEKVWMNLDNCYAHGVYGTYMEITVLPMSEKVV